MTVYDLPVPAARRGRGPRIGRWLLLPTLVLVLVAGALWEGRTFRGQAWLLSMLAEELDTTLGAGAAPAIELERPGPYDERLGYSRLPQSIERLRRDGWRVVAQARLAPLHERLVRLGMAPIYREKTQAGLEILDPAGTRLYATRYPRGIYTDFAAVPPLVARTLTFIENRELLDPVHLFRNPAVEWDRLATAVVGRGVRVVNPGWKSHGGSTLATQLEKSRHSPGGRTTSGAEKLRQMATASLRAYREGPITETARRSTLVEYLNALPLAALPGYGEVHGLSDGLWAWYDADFVRVNELLRALEPATGGARPAGDAGAASASPEAAAAYRQVLSLLLAQRRPAYYLVEDPAALDRLTDSYLAMLDAERMLPPGLAAAAPVARRAAAPARERAPLTTRKADLAVRSRVASLLDVDRLYDLDRFDLTVTTTLDSAVQRDITAALLRLNEPEGARAAGIAPLLGGGDPAGVLYSFTLYERSQVTDLASPGPLPGERVGAGPVPAPFPGSNVGADPVPAPLAAAQCPCPGANAVRVQVDSRDQPLDLNDGAMLELGSTAKLRTLVTYLELMAELHGRHSSLPRTELERLREQAPDSLTRFVLDFLVAPPAGSAGRPTAADRRGLEALLEAAMLREYSASPWEGFFTGGGMHHFRNFDADDNARVVSVRQGFRRSVNLVFVRLMRDLVEHYRTRAPAEVAHLLDDPDHPLRQAYLDRFVERDGGAFLRRYHRKYHGLAPEEALAALATDRRPIPKRLAAMHRSTRPGADFEEFDRFLRATLPREAAIGESTARTLYQQLSPERLSLADRGYVARVHPLELWTVEYLTRHPGASVAELLVASDDARRDAYSWLYRTGHKRVQDRAIRTLLEADAFVEIHRAWRRVGYPFDSLVPSYATAIGSSADRPSALAELLGILVNDGVRRNTERLARLHFGASTPFETVLEREPARSERVLHREVATLVRRELEGVVRSGTATRARKSIELASGQTLDIGGKTGTGDNRIKRAGVKASRAGVLSRTASFVFTVGDRFYGTVVVYVPGGAAADYSFTSSAAVQVFNHLLPSLQPLFDRPPLESEWALYGAAAASQPVVARAPRQAAVAADPAAAGRPPPLRAGAGWRGLVAVPAPTSAAMVEIDRRAAPGDGDRGFRFPDPRSRRVRGHRRGDGILAYPIAVAALASSPPRRTSARRRRPPTPSRPAAGRRADAQRHPIGQTSIDATLSGRARGSWPAQDPRGPPRPAQAATDRRSRPATQSLPHPPPFPHLRARAGRTRGWRAARAARGISR